MYWNRLADPWNPFGSLLFVTIVRNRDGMVGAEPGTLTGPSLKYKMSYCLIQSQSDLYSSNSRSKTKIEKVNLIVIREIDEDWEIN